MTTPSSTQSNPAGLESSGPKRLVKGLLLGGLHGVIFANAEVLAIALFTYILWNMRVNPFTPQITTLYIQEAIQLSLLGGVVALVGGRWIDGRPYRLLGVMTALLLPLPFLLKATAPLVMAGTMGVALGISCLGVRLLQGNNPLRWVALALLMTGPIPLLFVLPGAKTTQAAEHRPSPPPGAPNILWVIFDTTRADHLSLYGYERQTSPHLDQFAADSVVFERAYSTASWTAPSHASMLTGLYPRQHGCTFEHTYLAQDIPYLPEILAEAGYDTALFTGNPWLDVHSGLSRGFLHKVPSWRSSFTTWFMLAGSLQRHFSLIEVDKGAAHSNAELERWLLTRTERTESRPFFAFVNYTEAHVPYFDIPAEDRAAFMPEGVPWLEQKALSEHTATSELRNRYAPDVLSERDQTIVKALYDGGIRYEDRRFGELIELLRRRGELDQTLVIVTADHGELLGEHDRYGHGQTLDHPLVHVPLVMRWPGHIPGGVRSDVPVQLTELFGTVLEAAGLPEVQHPSLFSVLKGVAPMDRPIFAELFPPLRSERFIERLRAVGHDPLTYQFTSIQKSNLRFVRGPASAENLFDLSADPGETHNLVLERPAEANALRAGIEQFEREHPKRGAATIPQQELDAVSRERLESLGYVQ